MKTLKISRIIIPAFALLIGGSLAASLTSTLAWFQYATRAQVAYVDALSHCSKLLQISVGHDNTWSAWGNDFYKNDMANYIVGNHLLPITTGPQAKNAALSNFYSQPEFGRGGDYTHWSPASNTNYAQFTIRVRVKDVDGVNTPLANDVYLTKLVIQDDSSGLDLSDAIRVHLAVTDASATPETKYFLFANSVTETAVGGKLDLNNDGHYDKDLDSWGATDCFYGVDGGKQYSYLTTDANAVVADPDNPASGTTPISLGKTGSTNMTIVVTTWIEGWAKLDHGLVGNANDDEDTPIWDPAEYVNKKFNVGIRLGVKSHDTDHQN